MSDGSGDDFISADDLMRRLRDKFPDEWKRYRALRSRALLPLPVVQTRGGVMEWVNRAAGDQAIAILAASDGKTALGWVRCHGEFWSAWAKAQTPAGKRVRINEDGVYLGFAFDQNAAQALVEKGVDFLVES